MRENSSSTAARPAAAAKPSDRRLERGQDGRTGEILGAQDEFLELVILQEAQGGGHLGGERGVVLFSLFFSRVFHALLRGRFFFTHCPGPRVRFCDGSSGAVRSLVSRRPASWLERTPIRVRFHGEARRVLADGSHAQRHSTKNIGEPLYSS